jgi:hypothetical protein
VRAVTSGGDLPYISRFATALYDFEPTSEQEISLTQGAALVVLSADEDTGWGIAIRVSAVGNFPAAYAKDVENLSADGPQYADAVFEYADDDNADMLTIKPGDLIYIVHKDLSGWSQGCVVYEQGLIPLSYVHYDEEDEEGGREGEEADDDDPSSDGQGGGGGE